MTDLATLAALAAPTDDDDYGSARQTNAMSAFWERVESYLSPVDRDALQGACMQATTEEIIAHGLAAVRFASLPARVQMQAERCARSDTGLHVRELGGTCAYCGALFGAA